MDELPAIFVFTLAATAATMLFLRSRRRARPGSRSRFRSWVVALAFAISLRGLARWLWRRIVPRERTLIVGTGPLADATGRKLELFPDIHVEVVDQVDELDRGLPGLDVDRIIVASQSLDETLLAELLEFCRDEQDQAERRPSRPRDVRHRRPA